MQQILTNQSFTMSPEVEALDSGWVISGQYAIHGSCNPGSIRSIDNIGLQVGKTYVVTYEVINYGSGSVRVFLGSTSGTLRNSDGIYIETLVCTSTSQMMFFSDGNLTIKNNVSFFEFVGDVDNAVTISFYEGEGSTDKKWSSHYSYSPEMMVRFINSFFSMKNGVLWLHNVNELRNNFYGIQYQSKIKFYANINPTTLKLFYGLRIKSNKVWYSPGDNSLLIMPSEQSPSGMRSRLQKPRFRNLNGDWFADFLRNLNDPRFTDSKVALFRGEPLMGNFMEINIMNDDTVEVVLFEIDIKSTPMNYTY